MATYQQNSISSQKRLIKIRPLGLLAAAIALPLLVLLWLLSFIVSQKQWEQFWDSYLELE